MHLESASAVPWSTLGQAIDHLLRYAVSDSAEPETTVALGLQCATQQRLINSETAGSLRAELARVVNEYRPSDLGQALPLPAAARRMCGIEPGPPLVLAAAVADQLLVVHPVVTVARLLAGHYRDLTGARS